MVYNSFDTGSVIILNWITKQFLTLLQKARENQIGLMKFWKIFRTSRN